MGRRPGKWIPPEEVQKDVLQRRRRLSADVERTSSVPPAAFGSFDPMLEARLLEDDVVQLLLRHMALLHDTADDDDGAGALRSESVTDEEIAEFLRALPETTKEPPPDPLEGLHCERLWILLDFVENGAGLARQRATRELREAMRDLRTWQGVDRELLQRLVAMLGDARRERNGSVLLAAFDAAARRALMEIEP